MAFRVQWQCEWWCGCCRMPGSGCGHGAVAGLVWLGWLCGHMEWNGKKRWWCPCSWQPLYIGPLPPHPSPISPALLGGGGGADTTANLPPSLPISPCFHPLPHSSVTFHVPWDMTSRSWSEWATVHWVGGWVGWKQLLLWVQVSFLNKEFKILFNMCTQNSNNNK